MGLNQSKSRNILEPMSVPIELLAFIAALAYIVVRLLRKAPRASESSSKSFVPANGSLKEEKPSFTLENGTLKIHNTANIDLAKIFS